MSHTLDRFTSPEMSPSFANVFVCPGTALSPAPTQESVLRDHCAHARTRENLAVEQHQQWHRGRKSAPGYLEQCRQLTARAGAPPVPEHR